MEVRGKRKFIAYLVSMGVYFVLSVLAIIFLSPTTFNIESFVLQLGLGIMTISGAFYAGNAAVSFSKINLKYLFYTIIFISCVAFGWFLNENLTDKNIEVKYGDIKVEQIKTTYKPLPPIIHFDTKIVNIEKIIQDGIEHKMITDSISSYSDSLNYKIIHNTLINPDSIKAKTFWDVWFEMKARQDSIFVDREVLKEVPIPFYKNHWFYAWLGTASLFVLTLLGLIGAL